jgi:hypothetical protein
MVRPGSGSSSKVSERHGQDDLNTGKEWSAMDLADLQRCAKLNTPVEEIAALLMRSVHEVREKAKELGIELEPGASPEPGTRWLY